MTPEIGQYACVKILTLKKKLFGRTIIVPNIVGYGIRLFTWSNYDHSILYVGEGKIVEAQPSGAIKDDLSKYQGCAMVWSNDKLTKIQKTVIVARAEALVGTPYGFLDLFYLFLATMHIRPKFILRRVENENNLICSQLVALCGSKAGEDSWLCGEPNACLVRPVDLARRVRGQAKN